MGSEQGLLSEPIRVELTGDPDLRQSIGTLVVEIDPDQLDLALDVPDRFGSATLYNITLEDWKRVNEAINRAVSNFATDWGVK